MCPTFCSRRSVISWRFSSPYSTPYCVFPLELARELERDCGAERGERGSSALDANIKEHLQIHWRPRVRACLPARTHDPRLSAHLRYLMSIGDPAGGTPLVKVFVPP
mmetsp:Transcript_61354/g.107415  ORF Transcript_61354/g.107415 Transcript_61354/m.107415 type:complete len:107 (-) Transcript_61354:33-353(-)